MHANFHKRKALRKPGDSRQEASDWVYQTTDIAAKRKPVEGASIYAICFPSLPPIMQAALLC
jgi:hypothetical protein